MKLNSKTEVYAFGNYAQRKIEGGFYYRNPNTRGGVFKGPERVRTKDMSANRDMMVLGKMAHIMAHWITILKENRPSRMMIWTKKERKKLTKILQRTSRMRHTDTIKVANLDPAQGRCPHRQNDAANYSGH